MFTDNVLFAKSVHDAQIREGRNFSNEEKAIWRKERNEMFRAMLAGPAICSATTIGGVVAMLLTGVGECLLFSLLGIGLSIGFVKNAIRR